MRAGVAPSPRARASRHLSRYSGAVGKVGKDFATAKADVRRQHRTYSSAAGGSGGRNPNHLFFTRS